MYKLLADIWHSNSAYEKLMYRMKANSKTDYFTMSSEDLIVKSSHSPHAFQNCRTYLQSGQGLSD